MLKVGIVSAAWGAFAHLPAWRAVPGVEVAAICTSRQETAEAAARRLGIGRAFWDVERMCRDADLDIIDLGTRPDWRQPWAIAALQSGKHLYHGIPHAADLDGALAIDAAWRASGRVAVSDAFAQWLPAHAAMKAKLDAGFIGRPAGGRCHFNLALFNPPPAHFPYLWFAHAGHGVSAMRNHGSHLLHTLLHLLGPVDAVDADDRRMLDSWRLPDGGSMPVDTNDCATALIHFTNGATIQFETSWVQPAADGWRIDLWGDAGRLVARSPSFPTMRDCVLEAAVAGGGLMPVPLDAAMPEGVGLAADADPQPSVAMALSMHAMVQAIGGKGRAAPDFGQSLAVERVLEAMRRASSEGRRVQMQEVVG